MTTYLERRWGGGGENPTKVELEEALAELAKPDSEHPDCWLSDENGWVLSAHESGKLVFEDSEGDGGVLHQSCVKAEVVLELWGYLQEGRIEDIKNQPWSTGYGE